MPRALSELFLNVLFEPTRMTRASFWPPPVVSIVLFSMVLLKLPIENALICIAPPVPAVFVRVILLPEMMLLFIASATIAAVKLLPLMLILLSRMYISRTGKNAPDPVMMIP